MACSRRPRASAVMAPVARLRLPVRLRKRPVKAVAVDSAPVGQAVPQVERAPALPLPSLSPATGCRSLPRTGLNGCLPIRLLRVCRAGAALEAAVAAAAGVVVEPVAVVAR